MRAPVISILLATLAGAPALARGPFERNVLTVPGRVTEVVLEDFTGDGLTDLLAVNVTGLPPDEERWFSLFVGPEDRAPSRRPDHMRPVPVQAVAFDYAEVDGQPGIDLLLLDRRGVSQLHVGAGGFGAPRRLLEATSLARRPHEGALPRFKFAIELDKDQPRVLFLPTLAGLRVYRSLFCNGAADAELLEVSLHNRYGTDPGASQGKRNFAFHVEDELFEDHFRVRLKAPTSPWMRVTEGERPGIVLYFRAWDELKGKLFWFRNRCEWRTPSIPAPSGIPSPRAPTGLNAVARGGST